jgi:hypothetical protein
MLSSLGLGGDGDEVEAILNVEREFRISLDKSDAFNWITVGDVYASLLRVLPSDLKSDPTNWKRFCVAICEESGADSTLVDERTQLLAPPLLEVLKNLFRRSGNISS